MRGGRVRGTNCCNFKHHMAGSVDFDGASIATHARACSTLSAVLRLFRTGRRGSEWFRRCSGDQRTRTRRALCVTTTSCARVHLSRRLFLCPRLDIIKKRRRRTNARRGFPFPPLRFRRTFSHLPLQNSLTQASINMQKS